MLDLRVDLLWDFSLMAFEGRNFGAHATWNVLRGLLFDTHLDMSSRRRDPDRHAAARALVRASNGVLLDVLDSAMDLIESGEAQTLEHPELVNLARFARAEDHRIRRQLSAMERATASACEMLFRRIIRASRFSEDLGANRQETCAPPLAITATPPTAPAASVSVARAKRGEKIRPIAGTGTVRITSASPLHFILEEPVAKQLKKPATAPLLGDHLSLPVSHTGRS